MDGAWRGGGLSPPSTSVENYAKSITNFLFIYFSFYFIIVFGDYNVKFLGTCNTPLERCFQDLSNGILQALGFQKIN